jgi:hypothetical protein
MLKNANPHAERDTLAQARAVCSRGDLRFQPVTESNEHSVASGVSQLGRAITPA